jgi:hypothetical protein
MENQFLDIMNRVNGLFEKKLIIPFEMLDNNKKIDKNYDRFLCWCDQKVESVDELFAFESMCKLKRLPVWLKNTGADEILVDKDSIKNSIKEISNLTWNVLRTGFIPELNPPDIIDSSDNLWDEFPKYTCCPDCYTKENLKNSLIISSRGFITLPHTDTSFPGTTIVSIHEGRKLFICLEPGIQETFNGDDDISIEQFFECKFFFRSEILINLKKILKSIKRKYTLWML